MNCYLLHVSRLPSQPASNLGVWVIDWNWLELAWHYIAMTRNNLCIISISLIMPSASAYYIFEEKKMCKKTLPFEYSIIITDSTYNIWKWISLSWISLLLERNLNVLTWYTQSVLMRNGPLCNKCWWDLSISTYLILTFEDPL